MLKCKGQHFEVHLQWIQNWNFVSESWKIFLLLLLFSNLSFKRDCGYELEKNNKCGIFFFRKWLAIRQIHLHAEDLQYACLKEFWNISILRYFEVFEKYMVFFECIIFIKCVCKIVRMNVSSTHEKIMFSEMI